MARAFAGRTLDQVIIADFTVDRSRTGTMIAGQVFISLTTPDGRPNGPGIHVDVGTEIDPFTNIESAERKLLESALALVQRISEMNVEELYVSWAEWSKRPVTHWQH